MCFSHASSPFYVTHDCQPEFNYSTQSRHDSIHNCSCFLLLWRACLSAIRELKVFTFCLVCFVFILAAAFLNPFLLFWFDDWTGKRICRKLLNDIQVLYWLKLHFSRSFLPSGMGLKTIGLLSSIILINSSPRLFRWLPIKLIEIVNRNHAKMSKRINLEGILEGLWNLICIAPISCT